MTAELFLSIGNVYHYGLINWKMRDELLAEWRRDEQGCFILVGTAYVDGGEFDSTVSGIRFHIFNKEMDTALKGIIYGERPFFTNYPFLLMPQSSLIMNLYIRNLGKPCIMVRLVNIYPQPNNIFQVSTCKRLPMIDG